MTAAPPIRRRSGAAILRFASAVLALAVLPGCASLPEAGRRPAPLNDAAAASSDVPELPVGYGRLRPDEVTIGFSDGPLRIEVVPLREDILRLLVPEAAERLRALAEFGRPPDGGSLFLATFFTEDLGVGFQQSDLVLEQDGGRLRADRVVGITNRWGTGRLEQREPASAVFLFPQVDLEREFRVRYRSSASTAWASILPRIQAERGRVRGRAGGGGAESAQSSRSNFRILR